MSLFLGLELGLIFNFLDFLTFTDDEKVNIFKNLEKDLYKSVRTVIVDMILATEMTRHFEHLAKFVSVFGTDSESKDTVS